MVVRDKTQGIYFLSFPISCESDWPYTADPVYFTRPKCVWILAIPRVDGGHIAFMSMSPWPHLRFTTYALAACIRRLCSSLDPSGQLYASTTQNITALGIVSPCQPFQLHTMHWHAAVTACKCLQVLATACDCVQLQTCMLRQQLD